MSDSDHYLYLFIQKKKTNTSMIIPLSALFTSPFHGKVTKMTLMKDDVQQSLILWIRMLFNYVQQINFPKAFGSISWQLNSRRD